MQKLWPLNLIKNNSLKTFKKIEEYLYNHFYSLQHIFYIKEKLISHCENIAQWNKY